MGELIALCGIDGTGKSTQASLLQNRLQVIGCSTQVLWCRWDPLLARPFVRLLDRISGKAAKTSAVVGSTDESGDSRRALKRRFLDSPMLRRLWMALMVLDYGLQVAPKLIRARRSVDVVIVDRYRHDVLIDLSAGRELGKTPPVLRWLLPEPDLILVLDLDEEIAFARKPDSLDLTYLKDRRRLYLELGLSFNAVLIDASGSTDMVSESVYKAISSYSTKHGGIKWASRS